jgi:uncharacterized protein (TIGR03083 family)
MEVAEHIDALRREGGLLAGAASRAGLDAPVPPCAPWLVRDLLRHTGYVHRWAARHITERPGRVLAAPSEAEILRDGPPDAELLAWFRAGHVALIETLATADPALTCATFMDAPSPLAFWARRQAHETAIHRADAESASGGRPPDFGPAFAADGVDELVMGFGRRRRYQPHAASHGGRLQIVAAGTGQRWLVEAREGRLHPRRPGDRDGPGPAEATCTVAGPAPGLYLYLWNRADASQAGVSITGDPAIMAQWHSALRIRWNRT